MRHALPAPQGYRCEFCHRQFPTRQGVRAHTSAKVECNQKWQAQLLSQKRAAVPPAAADHSAGTFKDIELMEGDGFGLDNNGDNRQASPPDNIGPPPKQTRVTIEDGDDDDDPLPGRYAVPYPDEAGTSYGSAPTKFETMRAEQDAELRSRYSPFTDEDDWELAEWLAQHTTQSAADKFLKKKWVRVPFGLLMFHIHLNIFTG